MNLNTSNKVFVHDRNLKPFVRGVIRFGIIFFDIYWFVLLLLARAKIKKRKYKYEFSICAIFYNEELSLKEWIEYHLVIGVDHFYLFNHESTDGYKEILQPYIDDGIVTMINWPIPSPALMSAIDYFNKNYKTESHWVAYIDLDEYICPHEIYNIKDWISAYANYPAVVSYWKPYGSSGLIEHDNKRLITEQYTVAWDKYYDLGKTFFNNDFDIYKYDKKYLHVMNACVNIFGKKFAIPPINEFGYFIKFHCNRIGLFRNKNHFSIRINHYVTKSYLHYFNAKLIKGDAEHINKDAVYRNNNVKYAYTFFQAYCTTKDMTIYRYLTQLKVRLNNKIENHLGDIK